MSIKKTVMEVYVPSILRASGINLQQAKTCFYYTAATYLLPKRISRIPLLLIKGEHGTGKSGLLKQLYGMANTPKKIEAESMPTLRDELADTITALIDEGDSVKEEYLVKRYDKDTSLISHKVSKTGGWQVVKDNIFGATIIVRRTPFEDSATTSRSIIIKTRYNEGDYRTKRFKYVHDNLAEIAEEVNLDRKTSNRTRNNWKPLQAIAEYFNDKEWLEYSEQEIERNIKTLRASQKYEPEQSLLMVLREKMFRVMAGKKILLPGNVPLSEIRADLKSEFDIHFKNSQIQQMSEELGFRIVSHSNYPQVKSNPELLEKLLKEKKL